MENENKLDEQIVNSSIQSMTEGQRVQFDKLSKEMFGPDISSSITTKELATLIEGIRYTEKAINNPIDKNEMAIELQPLRNLFTKSVVSLIDIPANTKITRNMLTAKKPGTGIPEKTIDAVVGKTSKYKIHKDKVIKYSDLM